MRLALLMLCALLATAHADEDDRHSRAEYQAGKLAFDRKQFQTAYDHFKQAFLSSERPELLFNMALALAQLKRPHDAAEALRTYLKTRPGDPDRSQIEARIFALEEKQRLLDADQRPAIVAAPVAAPESRRRPRVPLIVGISVGTLLAVSIGVGLGVGLSGAPEHAASSLGAWPATR